VNDEIKRVVEGGGRPDTLFLRKIRGVANVIH
jgi:hypothetical protein